LVPLLDGEILLSIGDPPTQALSSLESTVVERPKRSW